jgi:UDP-2,3-diacylglucosamine pyrophosphatase LpxH
MLSEAAAGTSSSRQVTEGVYAMGDKGDEPERSKGTCLHREIDLYDKVLATLTRVRPLKVAVFSVDRELAARLATRLQQARVYHVNGQRDFLIPDVVIAESFSEQLLRAARLAELHDSDVTADTVEVETIRQAAQQLLPNFKYGVRRR